MPRVANGGFGMTESRNRQTTETERRRSFASAGNNSAKCGVNPVCRDFDPPFCGSHFQMVRQRRLAKNDSEWSNTEGKRATLPYIGYRQFGVRA
jgi:hypothetical protein